MEQNALTSVFLPAALVLIMFGVGLDLRARDFGRVARDIRGAVAGTIAQVVLVPLTGVLIALSSSLSGDLAVGIVIVSACPGGAVSNLISYLARADVALSVSLTAVSSVITVFTIPIVVNYALVTFGDAYAVELPILWTSIRLTALTLIPVIAGMTFRHFRPELARRSEQLVRRSSIVVLASVIAVAVSDHLVELPLYLRTLGLPLLFLNLGTIGVGWLSARAARLDNSRTMTLMIETGIQNGALGITIPALWIGSSEMAIPPAIYGVLMLLSASFLILFSPMRRSISSAEG